MNDDVLAEVDAILEPIKAANPGISNGEVAESLPSISAGRSGSGPWTGTSTPSWPSSTVTVTDMTEPTPALLAQVAGQQRDIASTMAGVADLMAHLASSNDMLERVLTGFRGDEPTPLEAAMHSVWLHGNWRWLTRNMTTEQREAAADAVQRYSDWLTRDEDEQGSNVLDLRWWR